MIDETQNYLLAYSKICAFLTTEKAFKIQKPTCNSISITKKHTTTIVPPIESSIKNLVNRSTCQLGAMPDTKETVTPERRSKRAKTQKTQ
ncbi:hypothetical protein L596_017188 [Steinernema carpocapsae]|uniref:Uncharacterized protein n=1 Tax=Steinernema carpocapsae TaxID=34508 RepID=A0A4U5N1N5_STECR|nr:hypothetical protein L596_017188 [Steinernema carpocapsae]